jgi:UPF0271 protein
MMVSIDLNSDLGESFGRWSLGNDIDVMRSITSANIACGFHAGDPRVMRETVRLAKAAGVAIGAHPGFPDLVGFGRRNIAASPQEVEDFVIYQVGALAGMAAAEQTKLQHVKPHGALYNMAIRDARLAEAIARGVAAIDRALILFGLPGSELARAADAVGLKVAAEGFADRAYEPDGSLTPRERPGAVIHDPGHVVRRAVRMAQSGVVTATNGLDIEMRVDTICTHGDTPGSHDLVHRIREALERAGIDIKAVGAQQSLRT